MRDEIEALESDLNDLKAAGSSYNTYKRLHETEIPAFEESLRKHTEKQQELLDKFERVGLTYTYAIILIILMIPWRLGRERVHREELCQNGSRRTKAPGSRHLQV